MKEFSHWKVLLLKVPFIMCKTYETKYGTEKLGYINTVIEFDESEEELKEKWTMDEMLHNFY